MGAVLRPTAAFLVALWCALGTQISPHAAQSAEPVVPLETGAVTERTIAGGQTHRSELTLRAGEHTSVTVRQHGVEIAAEAVGPDGRVVGYFNDAIMSEGEERVEITGTAGGRYALVVKTTFPRAAAGS